MLYRLFIVLGVGLYAGASLAAWIGLFRSLDAAQRSSELMMLGLVHIIVGLLLKRESRQP
jgi:hypothetical protein